MDKFWREFSKSNVISGALALIIWGVICYLAVVGQDVPDVLVGGGLSVMSFFFGSKTGTQTERLRSKQEKG